MSGSRSDGGPVNGSYPVGTTTITWTATDSSGNPSSCAQTVTVNDTEPPHITCPSSPPLEPTCPSGAIATFAATATDNCGVQSIGYSSAPGSVFPIGTTTVTATATDVHGNTASCSFTITVKTNQAVINDMINRVNATSLSGSQKQGLISFLNSALGYINSGDYSHACDKLDSFISKVQNYIQNGQMKAAEGNPLILSSQHVRNAIGCTNNPFS